MSSPIVLTLADVQLAFGHHPLLDHADLSILADDRIGLIGRNGTGKSSLLKVLSGEQLPDDGEVQRLGGLRVALVAQEPELDEQATVRDILVGDLASHEDWQRPARADRLLDELQLDGDALVGGLSGGGRKRVALASALLDQPDLLLLDEPTNHLDFDAIDWLAEQLAARRGALVCITHDRHFLDRVASRIVELDRGRLFGFPGNFSAWQARKADWLAAEQQQQARFDKLLAQEEVWIRQGIEARRTRNEGRVRRLEQLRRERAARRERQGNVSLALAEGQRSGKLVAELQGVSHEWGDRPIVRDLNLTLMRGDRLGIVGPNGAGKTTLLRIILGDLVPAAGTVRHGTRLTVGYFDQMRARLDPTATLAATISPGSEWVEIGNQRKHVASYLADFLFPPERAQSPVSTLSGGERARLALARLFAQPTNLLVMDEPTNDLDIETLELLEGLLADYSGTVLLVSHDRQFLDNIVTQTLGAMDDDGYWLEVVGGYEDWLRERDRHRAAKAPQQAPSGGADKRGGDKKGQAPSPTDKGADSSPPAPPAARAKALSSWEQRELDALPEQIAALEDEQAALNGRLADGSLYRDAPDEVTQIQARLAALDGEIEQKMARWELLEARR